MATSFLVSKVSFLRNSLAGTFLLAERLCGTGEPAWDSDTSTPSFNLPQKMYPSQHHRLRLNAFPSHSDILKIFKVCKAHRIDIQDTIVNRVNGCLKTRFSTSCTLRTSLEGLAVEFVMATCVVEPHHHVSAHWTGSLMGGQGRAVLKGGVGSQLSRMKSKLREKRKGVRDSVEKSRVMLKVNLGGRVGEVLLLKNSKGGVRIDYPGVLYLYMKRIPWRNDFDKAMTPSRSMVTQERMVAPKHLLCTWAID